MVPAAQAARVRIAEATVARLPVYLRALSTFADAGQTTVSSEDLACTMAVTSSKVRKDLSQLGSYGTRGVGYDVALLINRISRALGLNEGHSVVLVGVGNLGHALAGYDGFTSRGFTIAALVDADPRRVGELIGGLRVRSIDDLEVVVAESAASIGVIATPATAAQEVCDRLINAGITSILTFAPCGLAVPDNVDIRKVDLAVELQILSFHEVRKSMAVAQ